MKINNETKPSFLKVLLRSIPFLPGPELFDLVASVRKSQTEVDAQVVEAVDALRRTSTLISTLQEALEQKMIKLQQLREEHQRYSELAQIEARKAQALIWQVETTLGREQRKERWIALSMHLGFGLIFFVLGIAASEPSKRWISYLWSDLFH